MPVSKKLTIGVSVNLQRYENLRLAVEGEVATDEDAQDLALYLDHVLALFGRNDPETAAQIDRYRQRVMPVSDACREPEPEPEFGPEPESEPVPEWEPVPEPETAPGPRPAPPCEEPADASPAATPGPEVSPGPAAVPGFLSRREGGVPGCGAVGGSAPPASSGSAPVPPAAPPAAPVEPGAAAPPRAADDHGRCEECGAALSRQEAKLSRIFVERLLCKKCLDALQDERPRGG